MIDINKEAEEYAKNEAEEAYIDDGCNKIYNNYYLTNAIIDFVNRSKYVQSEKIKAQIEVLKGLDEINISNADNNFGNSFKRLRNKIKELQQQLKKLENE
jgi:hypothetical protein